MRALRGVLEVSSRKRFQKSTNGISHLGNSFNLGRCEKPHPASSKAAGKLNSADMGQAEPSLVDSSC